MTEATARAADEVARALVGLDEYTVTDAQESPEGVLTVAVIRTRPEAPCPGCGVFSGRVKSYRASTVIDAPAQGRPCRLVVTKRALRCDTPGCSRRTFTEATDALPSRARITRARDDRRRARTTTATDGGRESATHPAPSPSASARTIWARDWAKRLTLTGPPRRATPKTIRYRLLHVAARVRPRRLDLAANWPWTPTLLAALDRLHTLTARPSVTRPAAA